MIRGINHLTFAVADLERALSFYEDGLGARRLRAWPKGAYLTLGDLWLCLSLDPDATPGRGYTHVALDVAEDAFDAARDRLAAIGARTWKENRSEGRSVYILDPDGHRLELHVGTLASRMAAVDAAERGTCDA